MTATKVPAAFGREHPRAKMVFVRRARGAQKRDALRQPSDGTMWVNLAFVGCSEGCIAVSGLLSALLTLQPPPHSTLPTPDGLNLRAVLYFQFLH